MSKNRVARIILIDRATGKSYEINIKVPPDIDIDKLKPLCNVGDFIIIDNKIYRRVRGGFKEADEEDVAELVSSVLNDSVTLVLTVGLPGINVTINYP